MSNQLDLAQAYTRYRPLLLGALGRLASQGYAVAPDEGLGLIHDFFLEAWPDLQLRHDPSRSALGTYTFGAFVKFARPRIVRMNRWQAQIGDLEEVATVSEPSVDTALDVVRVRQTLAKLGEEDRELLLRRFGSGLSERELSQQTGTSRYHARQQLVDALARFVALLGDGVLLKEQDQRLAHLLWADQVPLDEAARRLDLTVPQARAGRARIMDAVTHALHGDAQEAREKAMEPSICDLWQRFASHPGDQSLRSRIQSVRDDVLEHIEDCSACGKVMPSGAEGLAAIYSALAADEEITGDADDLLRLRDTADTEVREAVVTVLYPRLPPREADALADIDPLLVFRGIDAVALLVDRLWRQQGGGGRFILSAAGLVRLPAESLLESSSALVREIRIMTKTNEETANRLLRWILSALRSYPALLPGIAGTVRRDGSLEIQAVDRSAELDLAKEWSRGGSRSTEVQVHAAAALAAKLKVGQGQT